MSYFRFKYKMKLEKDDTEMIFRRSLFLKDNDVLLLYLFIFISMLRISVTKANRILLKLLVLSKIR